MLFFPEGKEMFFFVSPVIVIFTSSLAVRFSKPSKNGSKQKTVSQQNKNESVITSKAARLMCSRTRVLCEIYSKKKGEKPTKKKNASGCALKSVVFKRCVITAIVFTRERELLSLHVCIGRD